jgi:hypothetical protein
LRTTGHGPFSMTDRPNITIERLPTSNDSVSGSRGKMSGSNTGDAPIPLHSIEFTSCMILGCFKSLHRKNLSHTSGIPTLQVTIPTIAFNYIPTDSPEPVDLQKPDRVGIQSLDTRPSATTSYCRSSLIYGSKSSLCRHHLSSCFDGDRVIPPQSEPQPPNLQGNLQHSYYATSSTAGFKTFPAFLFIRKTT